MLREIIFCLKYHTDVSISEKIRGAADYLEDEGIRCQIVYPEPEIMTKEGLLLGIMENDSEHSLKDILFLSDSSELSEILLGSGAYVVGLQHEENPGEGFPGLKYVFTDIDEVGFDSYEKAYQRYARIPWTILETKRCIIRETTVEDVDAFYEIYANPEMTRYMEGLFKNPEDEKKYQADYIEKVYGLLGFGTWTVVRKEDGKIIGRAGFSVRNGFDDVELGFLIGTDYQRQGYAYEVCEAILKYGREVLLFERIIAFVKAENLVSIHLCEKLGFEKKEEVDIEENIYGEEYHDGVKVAPSRAQFGKYIRMVLAI
ncbi:GNAT family N-acetyltransferase [Butyrivibrio sp. INlla16]|uniref:GNAT family N-acetyltransferase n=1 Tax=Butyrivibrio sp. INlla16 TaxID=1520807 RepID=UPI00088FCA5B|nr:GNAT family N-acetyltransferase [Butyrivibrio sp. INlla16]SDB59758.1 Protein N-acetyltransferase, RimJ/RimL family [Butyrivibrio sp. INlla16]